MLLEKEKEMEIEGITFTMKKMNVDYLPLVMKTSSRDDTIKNKAMVDLINRLLKDTFATEKEIKELPLSFIMEFLSECMKFNGLTDTVKTPQTLKDVTLKE